MSLGLRPPFRPCSRALPSIRRGFARAPWRARIRRTPRPSASSCGPPVSWCRSLRSSDRKPAPACVTRSMMCSRSLSERERRSSSQHDERRRPRAVGRASGEVPADPSGRRTPSPIHPGAAGRLEGTGPGPRYPDHRPWRPVRSQSTRACRKTLLPFVPILQQLCATAMPLFSAVFRVRRSFAQALQRS